MSDDLLPASATTFERALSGAGARLLAADSDVIRRSRDPSRCSAQFVPLLAWERSVRLYDPSNTAWNRARIANAFAEHCAVGSPAALESEIAFDTGQTIEIVEFWQERDLRWPYFAVNAVVAPGVVPDLDAVWSSAIARKNVRDMPIVRTRVVQPPAQQFFGASQRLALTLRNATRPALEPHVGAAQRLLPTNRVRPLS